MVLASIQIETFPVNKYDRPALESDNKSTPDICELVFKPVIIWAPRDSFVCDDIPFLRQIFFLIQLLSV